MTGDSVEDHKSLWEVLGRGSEHNRASTGIKHLDDITQGGFLRGRTYLVGGMPGTGKSIFSLQFLMAGLAEGENTVYVCVNEKPEDVIWTAKSLGWDLEPAVSAGRTQFLDMSPFFSRSAVINHNRYERRGTDVNIRKFLVDLDKYVRACSAKRLIIDSINLLLPGIQESRAATSARELVISIEQYISCTSLLTFDYWQGSGENEVHPIESYVSGVINLGLERKSSCFNRTMWIKKSRATAAGLEMYKFVIGSSDGISLVREAGDSGRVFARGNGDGQKADETKNERTGKQSAILMKD